LAGTFIITRPNSLHKPPPGRGTYAFASLVSFHLYFDRVYYNHFLSAA
jgi:hypothetical protein